MENRSSSERSVSRHGLAPLIAITPDCNVNTDMPTEATYLVRMNYASALADAGALPVVLPYLPERIDEVVSRFDGFVISGSTPGISEVSGRTDFELALIEAASSAGKPVLGICNGMQMIGLALGAQLIERLADPEPGGIDHLPRPAPLAMAHSIELAPDSRIGRLAQARCVEVNSLHRQAIEAGGRFTVAATAPDGVVEAIEGLGDGYVVGTQWHPEYRLTELDRALLADFIAAATRPGA